MNKKIFVTIISLAMLSSVMATVAPAEEIKNQADEQTFVYHFIEGWNLITIPVENDYTAMTLAENITGCTMISRFDAIDQMFKTYIVEGPAGFDFPIEDGIGYYVLVSGDTTLTISGDPLTEATVDLYEGLNLLGWYESESTTASAVMSSIEGCINVSIWDAVNQIQYDYKSPEDDDFTIEQGMGYWVGANTSSVWDGKLASPDFELEVYGMLGATILIKNIGNADASNIKYNVSVTGGILQLIDFTTEDVIPLLNVSNELNVDIFLFGLGMIEINVTLYADDETKLCNVQASGIIIGPFIIILPDELE